ncbi:NUDIX domain-containing protein [Halorussus vallis]|uniref:NUDIX hydrolase n=3 Tax=Halorussus TaxID=1070314 RepID=UPI0020A1244F|nr:NUDIX domain-containing protein [Halorussus vallis]USZ76112.1 NUDIX domain-containing protein [Halorussus vallis]
MTGIDALVARDDVARTAESVPLSDAEFETVRENVEAGYEVSVGAFVRDDAGRVALVRNRWSDGWVLPGGKVEPGETLPGAAVREAREETGLDVGVERPLEVVEQTFVRESESELIERESPAAAAAGDSPGECATAATIEGYFAVFETRVLPSSPRSLGGDLGENDAEIEAAAWFESIPDCGEPEHAGVLRRHF